MKRLSIALMVLMALAWNVARAQVNGTTYSGTATTSISTALGTNSNRRGFILQNTSSSVTLYAACGTVSTGLTTGGMHQVIPGGNWEPLIPCLDNVYVLTSSSSATWVATDE